MIADAIEYERAQEELKTLEERLLRMQSDPQSQQRGLTKAGIRKLIARLHEELAVYEGEQDVPSAVP